MIDLEEALLAYGREWRAAQPALPPLAVEREPDARPRSRWALAAAALFVVLALGVIVFFVTRSHRSNPTVGTPATTRVAPVPKVDVVPVYLPIDAADVNAIVALSERVSVRADDLTRTPTHAEQVQTEACRLDLFGGSGGNVSGFEDPGAWQGAPTPPSVTPPDAPTTMPRCTRPAARAAARIRTLWERWGWWQRVTALDADPTIATAIAHDVECIRDQGIDQVVPNGYVSDGWSMTHSESESARARLVFEQCFPPVVAARAPVRQAFRDAFVAEHRAEVANLQAAFDDYLRAIYQPSPHERTVTTAPDLARFDDGCIRVANPDGDTVEIPSYTALATAQTAMGVPTLPESAAHLGMVTVCDRTSIRSRLAWVFASGGKVVVVDAKSGKVLLDRTVRSP